MTPDLDLDAAIRTVIETIDEEGTQGELDRRADGLQVNARAIWEYTHDEDGSESWRHWQQQRAAVEYEAARDAFLYAYRFEKAMEVLRGR